MLNKLPMVSQARNPRALVNINDNLVRKIDYLQYVENNYYQPDSFHVRLPLYNLSDALNIEYWLSQPAILVEIFIGFPNDPTNYGTGDLKSMVVGGINNLDVRIFDNGAGFVDFDGFDLSKKFIDNKTVEKYPNQTSSQIATTLANKEGLTPVITPTTTGAGYYYTQDYVQMGNAITEWDLLTYLAQREGFQVFVRGTSLYFQPRPVTSPTPYIIQAQTLENGQMASMDGVNLTLSRNLNYARDIIVNVTSWNAYSGRVTATARAQKSRFGTIHASAQIIGQPQTFDYLIPGLTKQQANLRAQQLLEQISQHERIMMVDLPGDNIPRKDSVIQLTGVSPSADQTYYPDTITRTVTNGYRMQVRAKNHSPQSTVII